MTPKARTPSLILSPPPPNEEWDGDLAPGEHGGVPVLHGRYVQESTAAGGETGLADDHYVDALSGRDSGHLALAGVLSQASRLRKLFAALLVPATGTALVMAFAAQPLESGLLAGLFFLCSAGTVTRPPPWTSFLPLMRYPLRAGQAGLPVIGLAVVQATTGVPGLGAVEMLLLLGGIGVATVLTDTGSKRHWDVPRAVPTLVIGSPRCATDLVEELIAADVRRYVVVGRIAVDEIDAEPLQQGTVPTLGNLSDLSTLIEQHDVRLVVMSGEVPRSRVCNEMARSCLGLPVRLWGLSAFYEELFGHVPVADIDGAWFQYIIHPNYRAIGPAVKRGIDVVVGTAALFAALPLLGVGALLIRRDGGPALFKQVRIGAGGRRFTLYKLRTMRPTTDAPRWASSDDPRVTPIGRFLRRTHIDELPQLFNVLRGDMSLVGPRPEQPDLVDRLEGLITFYQCRLLVKPGLTGWAQLRCGYAGSEIGSAWKLSHDLYYIKHRSLLFDLAIICETLRTFVGDRQYAKKPAGAFFLLREAGPDRAVAVTPPAAVAAGPPVAEPPYSAL
jgi:exopolysaccharide biosynthesis polyprenyl glycosylphosphotransferase